MAATMAAPLPMQTAPAHGPEAGNGNAEDKATNMIAKARAPCRACRLAPRLSRWAPRPWQATKNPSGQTPSKSAAKDNHAANPMSVALAMPHGRGALRHNHAVRSTTRWMSPVATLTSA